MEELREELTPRDKAEPEETPAHTVWPPPPTHTLPDTLGPSRPSIRFMPVRRLSQAIISLLSGYAGLCILNQVIVASSSMPPSTRLIAAGVVNLALLLILLTTGVCFLIWMHRLDTNLRAFGVEGLRYTPGWGVASFFIPIMSLYRPYQVLREIWQASGPKARLALQWRKTRTPLLLVVWWISFLLMNIVEELAANTRAVSSGTTDIEMATNVAGVVSALLAIFVVRLFTARQENTAKLFMATET